MLFKAIWYPWGDVCLTLRLMTFAPNFGRKKDTWCRNHDCTETEFSPSVGQRANTPSPIVPMYRAIDRGFPGSRWRIQGVPLCIGGQKSVVVTCATLRIISVNSVMLYSRLCRTLIMTQVMGEDCNNYPGLSVGCGKKPQMFVIIQFVSLRMYKYT